MVTGRISDLFKSVNYSYDTMTLDEFKKFARNHNETLIFSEYGDVTTPPSARFGSNILGMFLVLDGELYWVSNCEGTLRRPSPNNGFRLAEVRSNETPNEIFGRVLRSSGFSYDGQNYSFDMVRYVYSFDVEIN